MVVPQLQPRQMLVCLAELDYVLYFPSLPYFHIEQVEMPVLLVILKFLVDSCLHSVPVFSVSKPARTAFYLRLFTLQEPRHQTFINECVGKMDILKMKILPFPKWDVQVLFSPTMYEIACLGNSPCL